jgi:hypothetical protein
VSRRALAITVGVMAAVLVAGVAVLSGFGGRVLSGSVADRVASVTPVPGEAPDQAGSEGGSGGGAADRTPAGGAPATSPAPAAGGAPQRVEDEPRPEIDPLTALDASKNAWANVDLEALRAKMPDNLYWKMAVPTRDPEVLRQREEERARWNVEYGKVLSNTATPEEIDAYYAHRQKLSVDYIEFITNLLTDYGEKLTARDIAMLKLAGEMHLARLEEIPRQIAEAKERAAAHDAARRAWLEQQKQFER